MLHPSLMGGLSHIIASALHMITLTWHSALHSRARSSRKGHLVAVAAWSQGEPGRAGRVHLHLRVRLAWLPAHTEMVVALVGRMAHLTITSMPPLSRNPIQR